MKDIQDNIIITVDNVLFFDLDGTLVDTNMANFLAYNKAFKSVTNSTKDLPFNLSVRFNRSVLLNVVPDLTKETYEKIIREKELYYKEFLHKTKLIKENVNILLKYSKTNKCFLVTNCRKNRALQTLSYFELESKFNGIFCRENRDSEVKINKFQRAISTLGIIPNIIIAFEDEKSEINDAFEAGIKIINPEGV